VAVSFRLSPEQEQLKLAARRFAQEHLRPLAAEVSREADLVRRALPARPVIWTPRGARPLVGSQHWDPGLLLARARAASKAIKP